MTVGVMADFEERIQEETDFLEAELERKRLERIELLPAVRELKKKQESMKEVLRQVRESYLSVEREFEAKESALRKLDNEGRQEKDRLSQLKRERDRLLATKEINAKYLAEVEKFRNSCMEAKWRKENRTDGLGAAEYQVDGAIHLAVTQRALLGDKRGLGKTLTSLITLDITDAQKVIVIAPADIASNWIREIQLWTPHRTPIKMKGMPKDMRELFLKSLRKVPEFTLVLNYDIWKSDPTVIQDLILLEADTLIVDESHHIMTQSSLQNKGVRELCYGVNTCPSCFVPKLTEESDGTYTCWCGHTGELEEFCSIKRVYPMTGTAILNKPQEVYPQLHILDRKGFPSPSAFLKDFCRKDEDSRWVWKHSGSQSSLLERIGPRYIARTQETAGIILPPIEEIIHEISMEELQLSHPGQWDAYQQIRTHAEIALNPDFAMPMPNKVTALMRLRQVLAWPAAIHSEVRDENDRVHVLNLDVKESWKLDLIEEHIRELNEEGERCIVFSQFKPGMRELGRRLGNSTAVYDGDTPDRLRDQIQLDFDAKTSPIRPVWRNVCCNYKSAGTGLNFTAASQMFLPDREWNPGKEDQAEGRMHRIGQRRDCTVHKLFVNNSVDIWMDSIITMKADIVSGFTSQAEQMQSAWDALRRGEM